MISPAIRLTICGAWALLALTLLRHVAHGAALEPTPAPGFILVTGPITAAEHEIADGSVTIGGYTLLVPQGPTRPITWGHVQHARTLGGAWELVLRPVTPRQPPQRIAK